MALEARQSLEDTFLKPNHQLVIFALIQPLERTDLPFNQILNQEIREWKKFRWALRKEDQQFLDGLFEKARLHVEAGDSVSRPWHFETILVSILLEHEKALGELRSKVETEEKRGWENTARNQ